MAANLLRPAAAAATAAASPRLSQALAACRPGSCHSASIASLSRPQHSPLGALRPSNHSTAAAFQRRRTQPSAVAVTCQVRRTAVAAAVACSQEVGTPAQQLDAQQGTEQQLQEQPAQDQQTAEQGNTQEQQEEFVIVNFYHLVDIPRPHEVIAQHRQWLEGKEVRGRIYISEQGINAQYGGTKRDAEGYARWLAETQPLFKGLFYTVWSTEGHQYPRLRLKYRPNLISLAGGMQGLPITDPAQRATPTPPSEWKRMLSEASRIGKPPLVLDVRNSYEWDAGHFEGAARPLEDNFNQTPTEALPEEIPAYLQDADPDQPVMMYCTGGIRCDVYSAYLRKKGFNKLYSLQGGIQNYLRQEGLDHWNGSLFVFDGRMAIRPGADREQERELVAAAPCQVCGGEAVLPHLNCANIDCNRLFIACDACRSRFRGCCCEACTDAPRLLRPAKTQGQYGNWSQYAADDELADAHERMLAGRGEGRISRRRKRQQALKARDQAKRAVMVERRRRAKEAMAELQQQAAAPGDGGSSSPAADSADSAADKDRLARLARLRELRQRLEAASAAA